MPQVICLLLIIVCTIVIGAHCMLPIYKSQDEIGPAMNISEIAQQLEQLEKLAEESDDVADILKDELIQTSYGNDKSGNSLFPYQLSSTRTLLTTLWHPGLHRLYRK